MKKSKIIPLAITMILGWGIIAAHAQSFKSFDNTKIAYTDQGNGKAVMLIHGFISTGKSWGKTAVKKQLLDEGYRVIIPDLRGNGDSGKSRDAKDYQDDAEIKDLIALTNHLQLNEYFALGYSRGAIILAKLLTREPRIKRAVLGGMGIDFTDPNWSRRIMFAEAFSGEAPLNDVTKGAVEYAKSIGADLKILGLLQKHQPVTSKKALRKLKIPILVIAGAKDKENGSPNALHLSIPGSQLSIIPGDHNGTYKTDLFSKQVINFIQRKE